jgi:hypothetical protein
MAENLVSTASNSEILWKYLWTPEFCLLPAFTLVSCLAYSSSLKMNATCPPKRRLTFDELHGVIFQKIKLFITTAVRISNPKQYIFFPFPFKDCRVLCYDPRSVGQSVLVSSTNLGLTTRFVLLSDNYGFADVGRFLWREDGSVVYICCWSSPAKSFSGPSPVGLATIFYCLRFETSFIVASYHSQDRGGGIRPRLRTGLLKIEFILHNIKIQFVPHRKPITFLLQSPTSYCWKQSLFIVRTIWNTQIHFQIIYKN